MVRRLLAAACFLLTAALQPAPAQAPSPETLAAAKDLMIASRAAENVKAILPAIVQHVKSLIVQGRPQVEKDFDAMVPIMLEAFSATIGQMTDQIATLYAANFTIGEMQELIIFYRTPTGQKFLEKTPMIAQQSMAIGQRFGASLGQALQSRIIEELRKKGHNI